MVREVRMKYILCYILVRIINLKLNEMEKLKTYGCLLLGLMNVFMLGAYADATIFSTKVIQTHQWGLTSMFGLMFIGMFLDRYRK